MTVTAPDATTVDERIDAAVANGFSIDPNSVPRAALTEVEREVPDVPTDHVDRDRRSGSDVAVGEDELERDGIGVGGTDRAEFTHRIDEHGVGRSHGNVAGCDRAGVDQRLDPAEHDVCRERGSERLGALRWG